MAEFLKHVKMIYMISLQKLVVSDISVFSGVGQMKAMQKYMA
ncbi:hypothetical protein ENTCAN_06413 [Enterobacter cancerogenus ATCC 35316]|nr:hypothetical protein ENTCAN_06413 [Enterobacter cancerogenus ATCC 35316]